MNADYFPYKCVGRSQRIYFGKQIKKLREENGLTIEKLAKIMEYRAETIERLENNYLHAHLPLERVLDYCRLFEVTPNDLLLNPKNPTFEPCIEEDAEVF